VADAMLDRDMVAEAQKLAEVRYDLPDAAPHISGMDGVGRGANVELAGVLGGEVAVQRD
jgi:hypothetical protein